MQTYRSYLGLAGRTAAMAAFLTGAACYTFAQQPASAQQSAAGASSATSGQGSVLIAASEAPMLNLSAPAASYSSSSSEASPDSLLDARLNLSSAAMDAAQPPPRRRYGRPNYSDSHTNPDGSSKFAFMAGAGASIPVQDTGKYLTTSYAFQVGAGRNFNKNVGVLLQFDYDHFGFQGSTLSNQSNLYFGQTGVGLDGSTHIWSFTLDPTFNFYSGEKTGAYAVGGVGFYHKYAQFTLPAAEQYCDPFYGCYQIQANQPIDWYNSNAVGINGGLGLTYKPSRFASERIYLEARYVWMDNSPRAASATNLYPPNANQTYYIPVTVGLRF